MAKVWLYGFHAVATRLRVAPESIAPTLAFALGLPGSREQDARADVSWFAADARGTLAPRVVAAFGLKSDEGAVDPVRLSGFVKDIAAGKFKDQVPAPLARSLWVRQNVAEINAIAEIARSL